MKLNYKKKESYDSGSLYPTTKLVGFTELAVKITYSQMEDILEKKLPKSAYKYQAYFSNSNSHVISAIWLELGYTQIELVLGEYLVLKKIK